MTNPWLTSPETVEPREQTRADKRLRPPSGPSRPQRGMAVEASPDDLPVVARREAPALWVVGTHGGAGESSLAQLDPGWGAAAHAWPRPQHDTLCRVVLVARTHMAGLEAARAAARQWASGALPHVELLGLVFVADAPGRLPRPLRDVQQVVRGGVPRTWDVPWHEPWRMGESPVLESSPRAVRQLVDELRVLCTLDASSASSIGRNTA